MDSSIMLTNVTTKRVFLHLYLLVQIKMILQVLFDKFKKWVSLQSLANELRGKYHKLLIKRPLSRAQKQEIQNFYKKTIGHKVPLIWHKFLYSRTTVYSPAYIPVGVYRTEMIGRLNNFAMMEAYADKNVSEQLFPDVVQPKTYVKNIHGHFYANNKAISREEAIALCQNIENAIIKPSLSTRGAGVRKINIEYGVTNHKGLRIEQLFDQYGQDFILQACIEQHDAMRALNPSSVNTIRLLTYRNDMDVKLIYGVIRIGREGTVIDNESAGGISARIETNGTLAKYAFGSAGTDLVEKTDCGITLEGYAIPSYEQVVETAKRLHLNLPHFDIAAWDFAVGKEGQPIFIEWNANPDLSQSAFGPAFGNEEQTAQMLKEIYKHKNTRHRNW